MEEVQALMNEYEALRRWRAGEVPWFSTGICESMTCGYGKLDDLGYWEYPLYPAEKYLELVKERRNGNGS